MSAALALWIDQSSALLWHGFVVFIRVGALVALLPGFGEQAVPARIKIGVAIAFSMIVAPAVAPIAQSNDVQELALIIFSETLTGLFFGLGIRLFVLALQTAGTIAAQSTSLSQILGGASIEPIPAMGYILVVAAICLALIMGLHVKAAQLLILSYEFIPVGVFSSGSDVATWGTAQVKLAFRLAFTLAAPFVILSILYNLALGAINRAMPQLMVAFVGAPFITFGGLFLLFLTAPLLLSVWLSAFDSFLFDPLSTSR